MRYRTGPAPQSRRGHDRRVRSPACRRQGRAASPVADRHRRPAAARAGRAEQRRQGGRGAGAGLRRAIAHQGARPRGMMSYIRDLRLIPIAVIACACLFALKAADLLLDGGSLIAGDNAPTMERTSITRTSADVPRPSSSMLSWASQMFNFPDGSGASTAPVVASLPADRTNPDITGSVPAETADKDKQAKTEQAKADPAKPPETRPPGTVIPT